MKHIVILTVMLLIAGIACGQSSYKKVDAKTFQQVKVDKQSNNYTPTGYYYTTSKGQTYEIHTHKVTRGENAGKVCCYIQRTSAKTGKTYWQKIDVKPEELHQ